MQGYFCYSLEGSKEELEEALGLVEEIAKQEIEHEYLSASVAKELFAWRNEIQVNVSYDLQTKQEKEKRKNTHILKFDMGSSGNINYLFIDFSNMPYVLSKTFVNLRVSGEGYLLDDIPKEAFVSERESNKYEIDLLPEYTTIY